MLNSSLKHLNVYVEIKLMEECQRDGKRQREKGWGELYDLSNFFVASLGFPIRFQRALVG